VGKNQQKLQDDLVGQEPADVLAKVPAQRLPAGITVITERSRPLVGSATGYGQKPPVDR
jgi:hypothetical protein